MGVYKNFVMGVEELIWSAMENGLTDEDLIYAYVFMHEKRASRNTVASILAKIGEH